MLHLLAYLTRHGTSFLAGGLFIGLVLPPLAALIHPALRVLVFLLTTTSFLSVNWPVLARHARRPALLALVLLWTLVGVPVATALAAKATTIPVITIACGTGSDGNPAAAPLRATMPNTRKTPLPITLNARILRSGSELTMRP